ncbi:MAG: RIP metalloprotease [Kofleriaceae bacterium]
MNVLIAILALGFLIVVHEAGHFIVARLCGMRVERFSIGFGPGILKKKAKSGTVFQIAPIPFGGFVEIKGMNIAEDVDPNDNEAYPNRPAWQRFVTIFAGPATNYLSAIVLAFGLYTCHGVDVLRTHSQVAGFLDGYDSATKLQLGDDIIAVDGNEIIVGQGKTLSQYVVDKGGQPVTLTVERQGVRQDIAITPRLALDKDDKPITTDDGKQVYRLGIQLSTFKVEDAGVLEAAKMAAVYPVEQTQAIGAGLYEIVKDFSKADPGGAIRIVEEFTKALEMGFVWFIKLLMLLSVYLGLFNLFPLPALDGGRLVFLGYELVTRRRANPKIEATVHMAGIMVLFVVLILVTVRDVGRLFKGGEDEERPSKQQRSNPEPPAPQPDSSAPAGSAAPAPAAQP